MSMKLSFILLFLISSISNATINPLAQWNVQTSGAATNGGFFVTGASGTDYSLQNAAQWSVTDAVTAGTTTIISATAVFTAQIVGNGCYASGGTGSITAVWHEVTAYTNATTIVVDGATGLTAGTGVTLKCGGALSLLQTAAANALGHTIWVKAGTYTSTTSITLHADIGQTIVGYNTTHGDITLASQLARPLFTTATNSTILIDLQSFGTDAVMTMKNISFSNTAGTRSFGFEATGARGIIRIENCLLDGFSTAFDGPNGSGTWNWNWLELISTEIKNSTGIAIYNAGGGTGNNFVCRWCYIHDNGGHAVSWNDGTLDISHSIFSTNTGSGIFLNGDVSSFVSLNSDYVSNTVSGIDISAGVGAAVGQRSQIQFINNIFYGNGAYGANISVSNVAKVNYFNAYGANITAARNNFTAGAGDVTLSASPFTSSTNFALNSNAGGGTLLKATGYPGVLVGSTSYMSIGAIIPTAGSTSVTIGFPSN